MLVGVCAVSLLLTRPRPSLSRFTPVPLPERAVADFDGDGEPDVAQISAPASGLSQISVGLSGSDGPVSLDATAAAVIGGDVDHDGDLDLLATTASGAVVVWLNDGHGRFTREEPSSSRSFSDSPAVSTDRGAVLVATVMAPHLIVSRQRNSAAVSLRIQPLTASPIVNRQLLLVRPLRAPPLSAL